MRRFVSVFAITAFALVALAAPAWAHVEIQPPTVTKGTDAVLTFVVPNEVDSAKTTKIEVQFPADTPITEASTQPVAGFTAEVATKKLDKPVTTDAGTVDERVDTITWTATSGGFGDGQFQEFPVAIGVPDADSLAFPTIQTYSDGKTVRWIEETPAGGPEPENPVPTVKLVAGEEGSATTPTTAAASTASSSSSDDADTAKTIGIIAIIVGAIALIVAIVAVVGGRKKTPTA